MQEVKIKILKVGFDKITLDKAAEKAIKWAKEIGRKRYIVTPNPEFLLEAEKNEKFLRILNRADLSIPDGTGILWAATYLEKIQRNKAKFFKILKALKTLLFGGFFPKSIRKTLLERVTGTDLMEKICKKSAKENLKIFLLGAKEGIAEKAKKKLSEKYPGLNIVGTYSGYPKENNLKIIDEKEPDILFVAYGAPAQEFWIDRNLPKLKSVKLAMGIGGAFDFIAGERKRAPKLIQNIGLEWLYRLIQEPKRAKRIFNASVKFPVIIIKKSLK